MKEKREWKERNKETLKTHQIFYDDTTDIVEKISMRRI
jgi:hypothetical protein